MEGQLISPAGAYILGFPAMVFWILIPATGFAVFAYTMWRRWLPLKAAAADFRGDRIGQRLLNLLKFGIGQFRQPRYPVAGILHIVIFFGFLVLSIRSVTLVMLGLWEDFIFPGLGGDFGRVYSVFKDAVAFLTLLACLAAMIRRGVFRPVRYAVPPQLGKGHEKEAVLVLALISSLMVADMLFEGSMAVATTGGADHFAGPGIMMVSWLLQGISLQSLQNIHIVAYFIHELIFFVFLCLLPLGKHFHVITSLPNVLLMKLELGRVKPLVWGVTEEELDELNSFGVQNLEDFTWKHILDFYTCADCGRCSDRCPAARAGTPLSPRFLTLKCRDYIYKRYPVFGKKCEPKALIGGILTADEIWSCTTCGACEAECPLFIEYIDKIIDLRRGLLDQGDVPEGIQEALENIAEEGNSFGEAETKRGDWCRGIECNVKDIRDNEAENLWFVGDFAAFDVRAMEASKSLARVLDEFDIDFAIAYDREKNSGNDVRRLGEEGLFQELREHNLQVLQKAACPRVFTTDPHTYNCLKNDYSAFGKEVLHYSEFMLEQLNKRGISFERKLSYKVTYHDPCYLGRYHGVYQAPREILKRLGVELVEMPNYASRSFCCGGGGGGIWLGERQNVEKNNLARVKEALQLQVDVLVVCCPKCLVMFEDALKSLPASGGMVVKDLSELMWEAAG